MATRNLTHEEPLLRGWICPSHRGVVWDAQGHCPRCGVVLEPGCFSPEQPRKQKLDYVRRRFIGFGLAVMSTLVAWACGMRQTPEARDYSGGYGTGMDHPGMMGSGGMMGGHAMMGDMCPMCGQSWRSIPSKLAKPKSEAWLADLRDIFSLERLSLVQYQADEDKYQVHMPYHMVIPQEELHIRWISELFAAYGLSAAGPTPAVRRSSNVNEAFEIALKLEADLIPRYEQLIAKAEDPESGRVLGLIRHQTRMHYMMFSHALRMGGMMGPGREHPGIMRRGR
jgi:hypothetical protein